jgi:hypothetical protein
MLISGSNANRSSPREPIYSHKRGKGKRRNIDFENVEVDRAVQLQNDRMLRRGLDEMRQALELIPENEKRAFTEAMARAPKLVEIETNFER